MKNKQVLFFITRISEMSHANNLKVIRFQSFAKGK